MHDLAPASHPLTHDTKWINEMVRVIVACFAYTVFLQLYSVWGSYLLVILLFAVTFS